MPKSYGLIRVSTAKQEKSPEVQEAMIASTSARGFDGRLGQALMIACRSGPTSQENATIAAHSAAIDFPDCPKSLVGKVDASTASNLCAATCVIPRQRFARALKSLRKKDLRYP